MRFPPVRLKQGVLGSEGAACSGKKGLIVKFDRPLRPAPRQRAHRGPEPTRARMHPVVHATGCKKQERWARAARGRGNYLERAQQSAIAARHEVALAQEQHAVVAAKSRRSDLAFLGLAADTRKNLTDLAGNR